MHRLDQDIALTEERPGVFAARVSPHWSIHYAPNGGYLMALLARAMLQHATRFDTPILTANYIARSEPGDAVIEVEQFADSTQFQRFSARLIQQGAEKVRAMGTFKSPHSECDIRRYEAVPFEVAPRSECVAVPNMGTYTFFDHMDVLLDPCCFGWMFDQPGDRSEQKGWVRFKESRPHDVYGLALVCDAFPPAILASQGMVAWVPTIELSVSIRNQPATEWLKARFATRFVDCGICEEDGEVWDEQDRLVAICRQIAQFKPGT